MGFTKLREEKTIVPCKKCGRPYKKGARYPNEVCLACKKEGED